MGIETIIAIGAIAASAAAAGTSVHQSQEASRQSSDSQRDQQNAIAKQNADLAAKENVAKQTDAMRAARQRQLVLAAQSSGYGGTVATSPLGLPGGTTTPSVGGKQKLGE